MNYADRIKETTTVTSTATISLAGAATGYRSFSSALTTGTANIPVCIVDSAGNWEIGFYTLTNSSLLTRESVVSSSNNNSAVAFTSGSKDVFCTIPSAAFQRMAIDRDVTFSPTIPLSPPGTIWMDQKIVSGAIQFVPAAGAVKGAYTTVRLVADGINTPTYQSFSEDGGSAGYVNTSGIINTMTFWYDGYDYWYSARQAANPVAIDMVAPGASSAAVSNSTPATVTITASESLNSSYTPAASAFTVTGHTVLSVSVSGNSVNLSVSPSFANGEVQTISYVQPGANGLRDLSGNLMPSFSNLSVTDGVQPNASALTMTGPTSGSVGAASAAFTVALSPVGSNLSGTAVATPSDGGAGGTFNPTSLNLTQGSPSGTFTYTPSSSGNKTISLTNNASLSNPTSITLSVAAVDSQAPNLSSPVGTQTGSTTATATVSTDEGNGTLYYMVSTNTTETPTVVKAGFSQAVTAVGTQNVSFSGLTAGTTYYTHFLHKDAAGNESSVANGPGFTTLANSNVRLNRVITNCTESASAPWKYTGSGGSGTNGTVGAISMVGKPSGVNGAAIFKVETHAADMMVQIGTTTVIDAYVNSDCIWSSGGNWKYITRGGTVVTPSSAVAAASGDLLKIEHTNADTAADFSITTVFSVSKDSGNTWTQLGTTNNGKKATYYAKAVPAGASVISCVSATGYV
jgi:hypothetical protein